MRGWPCAVLVLGASAAACHRHDPARATDDPPRSIETEPHERELAQLVAFEAQRRGTTDVAALPPSNVALGPDPYRIARLPDDDRLIGLLRGASAVVLLGADGRERARADAPRSPSGLAVSRDGDVLVVGEGSRDLIQYRVVRGQLERLASLPIGALGMRDLAVAPDGHHAYVVEGRDGRLLEIALERAPSRALRASRIRELGRCHGPIQVVATASVVAVDCLLDHTLEIRRDHRDVARIHHDGPIWGFAVHGERDGGLWVAAGGVEDHPLEREDGGFGYIDSYVYLYRLATAATQPTRLAAIDTSALDAVTPKWVALEVAPTGEVSVTTAGYASASLVTMSWPDGALTAPPRIARRALVPGTAAAVVTAEGAVIAANPLFDAWVVERAGDPELVAVASGSSPRSIASRIGELLMFTTLMAPWNSTEGKLSRFTCETCHYEGNVDGRVHFTGRGTVHATTRPLFGLFNDRPYFSRALDKTMAGMVHAEFRVTNRHNGRDPWFSLTQRDVPWLRYVEGAPVELSPETLREAFMAFLVDFTHRENPAAVEQPGFTTLERAGARTFRDRCAGCHAARLVTDDPRSIVPFERWERLVRSATGPIVWARDGYEQTGVLPYVHDRGARTPSLRRISTKWPYFTNGSARSLAEVLDRFGWDAQHSYHDGAPASPAGRRLTEDERAGLRAFLELL